MKIIPAIFFDVKKAFDEVWYDGVFNKLLQTVISIHLVKLIQSFLSNRYFNIKVKKTISSSQQIIAAVPQGSCLSLYLYLVYTNDIRRIGICSLTLFSNDRMFYSTNRNSRYAIVALQKQVDSTFSWFQNWRLKIKTDKIVAIIFNDPVDKSS